ncbi:hypothetical protein CYLTODRAFT_450515 [Cylindrobasidium torrendii FP15055 ss-10]|uniref:Uncharacterized protein n=1 Tax=Cylindrobasidium torrendii FP15055 ss-10 TaxID=1314674 RepID=A0A0D7BQG7_9AGAR|nr:hypothetical protein CYLTODRAFT_450515 [Cylindrobasidium torrendii FP15055 ss-10]
MQFFAIALALFASVVAAETVCSCQDATTVSCIVDGIQTFPYSCQTPKNDFTGVCEGEDGSAACNPPAF